ncbi:MAG: hypothetical protein R3F20_03005 [Planctomycetota bacterium]
MIRTSPRPRPSASPSRRRDAGGSNLLLVIVILFALVAVVSWVARERFAHEVEKGIDRLESWNAAAIAEDPVRYLDYVERKTGETRATLAASRARLATERGRLEARRKEAERKITAGEAALDELREVYRAAEAGGYPATWRETPRDRDFLRRQLVALDRELRSERTMREAVTGALAGLEDAVSRLEDLDDRCERQLATLPTEREVARLGRLDAKATERFTAMQGVLREGASAAPGELVGLEDLVAPSAPVADEDARIREILEGR